MIRFVRDLRLIPIAVIACTCLLALKLADILLSDSSPLSNSIADSEPSVIRATPDVSQSSSTPRSWASEMFNFPTGHDNASSDRLPPLVVTRRADKVDADITGSVPTRLAENSDAPTKPAAATPPGAAAPETKPAGTVIPLNDPGQPTGAERAILERLQARREELDARARELDIRESLLNATQKRVEGELNELKEVQGKISTETQQKEAAQDARFKGLVTMYENMKPRDAAKIFDRLELDVLIQVASKIEPRKMADIMAQMSPDVAQRLTVELASRAEATKQAGSPTELPKIDGQPQTP
jgi:flagellar motility protein MotE (MotC chaperone)